MKTFSDLLPVFGPVLDPGSFEQQYAKALYGTYIQDGIHFLYVEALPLIQRVWREPAPLLKESGLMLLAATYMRECANRGLDRFGIDAPDRFLLVLLHALKHVHLLRYCANPECKEPYFVARRGSQIYCSGPCAQPAKREAKLKWWREHGAERREKSREKRGKHAKAKKA